MDGGTDPLATNDAGGDAPSAADGGADGTIADGASDASPDAFDANCGDTSASALNCGECGHSCLGEACVSGVCGTVEIQTGGGETVVLTDATYAYWGSGYGDVYRRSLDGAPIEGLADAGTCTFADATLDGTRLYWTCRSNPIVESTPLAGSVANVVGTSAYPSGLAVDATNVYWCDGTRAGGVFQTPKNTVNGGAGTSIATEDDPYYGVQVHVGGGHVYWLAIADLPDTAMKVLRRAPIGGGARETVASQIGIRSFAIDGAHVYWSLPTQTIVRADLAGTNASAFVTNEDALSVVIDGAELFWGTSDGHLRRARTSDGKGVVTLAQGFGPIGAIAVGPKWVVFLADGKVLRVAR